MKGIPIAANVGKIRFEETADDLLNDYRTNKKRSPQDDRTLSRSVRSSHDPRAPARSRLPPISKLSLSLTIQLATVWLGEPLSCRLGAGVVLMTIGALSRFPERAGVQAGCHAAHAKRLRTCCRTA